MFLQKSIYFNFFQSQTFSKQKKTDFSTCCTPGKQAKANKKDRGGNQGKQKKTQAGNASSKEAIIAKIEAMGKVEELPHDYEVEFDFPPVDELTVPVIQVKNASFGYANGPTLFHDVDGGIDLDSKIALIGANGRFVCLISKC